MVSLSPEDVRYMIIKRAKGVRGKPRGRPFEEGYDPRRYDLQARKDG